SPVSRDNPAARERCARLYRSAAPLAHRTDRLGSRGLKGVQRGSSLVGVGGRIVVLRGRTGEIISEPDDPGGPNDGPPAVLENRAHAHREHAPGLAQGN